jgi:hypothetical protein
MASTHGRNQKEIKEEVTRLPRFEWANAHEYTGVPSSGGIQT